MLHQVRHLYIRLKIEKNSIFLIEVIYISLESSHRAEFNGEIKNRRWGGLTGTMGRKPFLGFFKFFLIVMVFDVKIYSRVYNLYIFG